MGHNASGLDALQELTHEHEAVLLNLAALQQVLGEMQDGLHQVDSAALDTAENVVHSLRMDLAVHLRKKEEILFPNCLSWVKRCGSWDVMPAGR